MDISWESVEDSFTYFSIFSVVNGKFNISPQKHHQIKALMHWDRIHLMIGRYPQLMIIFLMDQIQRLINQFKNVETFWKDPPGQDEKINPHSFLNNILWD